MHHPPDPPAHATLPPTYHSFMVRFWRTAPDRPWHATLQRTSDTPAVHFAGVDLFFNFLLAQLGEETTSPPLDTGDDLADVQDGPQ